MRRKTKSRFVAWLLVVAMMAGVVPTSVIAAPEDGQPPGVESIDGQASGEAEVPGVPEGENSGQQPVSTSEEGTDVTDEQQTETPQTPPDSEVPEEPEIPGASEEGSEELRREPIDFTDLGEELKVEVEELGKEGLRYRIQFLKEGEEFALLAEDTFRIRLPEGFTVDDAAEPTEVYNCKYGEYDKQTDVKIAEYKITGNVLEFRLLPAVETVDYAQMSVVIAARPSDSAGAGEKPSGEKPSGEKPSGEKPSGTPESKPSDSGEGADEEPSEEEADEAVSPLRGRSLSILANEVRAAGQATITSHTFSGEDLPEGFQKIVAKVFSQAGGYSEDDNPPIGFEYQVYLDDDVLYALSVDIENDPEYKQIMNDEQAVKNWLDSSDKYPKIRYEYNLGKNFSDFTGETVDLTLDGMESEDKTVGFCQIKDGVLQIELNPICAFLNDVFFKFGMKANLNEDKLTGDPQEVVFDENGELILQTEGMAGGGGGSTETPDYEVTKTTPKEWVSDTFIDYEIQVDALKDGKYLNGTVLKDIVTEGNLQVEEAKVTLTYKDGHNSEETIDLSQWTEEQKQSFTYTFEPSVLTEEKDTITSALFKLKMGLTAAGYQEYINAKGVWSKDVKNKASLVDGKDEKPLAESEEVPAKMNAQFFSKTGKEGNLEGTRWLWTIKLNTYLPSMDYGYLVDTLCWTDHQYDFTHGIYINGNKRITNFKPITGNIAWEALTAEDIHGLPEVGDTVGDTAYYYLIDEVDEKGQKISNPFYTPGGEEPQYKQRAILIIPYKGLQGTTESKKVKVEYATDLNMHGLSAKEYWDTIKQQGNEPSINNSANLLWKNTGEGPGPARQDKVEIGKDTKPYPGSVVKRGTKYDPKTQEVSWTIDVNKIGVQMTNAVLTDLFPVDGYDRNSLKLEYFQYKTGSNAPVTNGVLNAEKTNADGISYELNNDGDNEKLTINLGTLASDEEGYTFYTLVLKMKLKDPKYLSTQDPQSLENKISLSFTELNGGSPEESEAAISIPNTLISKDAVGSYNYDKSELSWKVTINPNSLPIENPTVTDVLEEGFEFGELEKVVCDGKDVTEEWKAEKDNDGNHVFSLSDGGSISKPYTFYFTTMATAKWRDEHLKGQYTDGQPFSVEILNTAILSGTIYDKEIDEATARDTASNTIEKPLIDKSGVYHEDTGTIDWTIELNKDHYDISDLYLLEELNKENTSSNQKIHELDIESVKISAAEAGKEYTDLQVTESNFDEIGFDGFKYYFGKDSSDSDEKNYRSYLIEFTTVLTGMSPVGTKIQNKVYMKNDDNNVDNESGFSDGGYDGNFDMSQISGATPRPRIQIQKISSNSVDTKFPLKEVGFSLSTYTYTVADGVITLGDEATKYGKQYITGESGNIVFNNIKTSQTKEDGTEERFICVLEEDAAAAGYKDLDKKYYVYFAKDKDDTKLKSITSIKDSKGNVLVDQNDINTYYKYYPNEGGKYEIESITITNEPSPTEFSFTKKEVKLDSYSYKDGSADAGGNQSTAAAKVEFKVIPTDGEAGKLDDTKEFSANDSGKVTLTGLDAGTYWLEETQANPGQKQGKVKFTVTWNAAENKYEYKFLQNTAENMKVFQSDDTEIIDELNKVDVSLRKRIGYMEGNQEKAEPLKDVTFKLVSTAPTAADGGKDAIGVKAGSVVQTQTTDVNGNVTFKDLPIGNYNIYEIYKNNGSTARPGYVAKENLDTTNGESEHGGELVYTLSVTEKDKNDSNYQKSLDYKLTPVRRKDAVTVGQEDPEPDKNAAGIVYNKPIKGTITLEKEILSPSLTGLQTGHAQFVNGAEFGLYRRINGKSSTYTEPTYTAVVGQDSDGKDIGDGKLQFEEVEYGDYDLKEIKAPEGFEKSTQTWQIELKNVSADELNVTGTEGGEAFEYEFAPYDGIKNKLHTENVKFFKHDKDNQPLSGISFEVYRRGAGKVSENGDGLTLTDTKMSKEARLNTYYRYLPASNGNNGTLTTNAQGELTLENVPMGDYLLVEKYENNDLQEGHQEKAVHVSISSGKLNTQGSWQYTTEIHETNNPLAYNEDNDCYTVNDVNDWTLKEIKDDYKDGSWQVENLKKYGFVNLQKVESEEGRPLAGAVFEIYRKIGGVEETSPYLTLRTDENGKFVPTEIKDDDGKPVDGYYTDENGSASKHLWYGDYVLKEKTAPESHRVEDTSIEFTIGEDKTGHQGTAWISLDSTGTGKVDYITTGSNNTEESSSFVNTVIRGSFALRKISSEFDTNAPETLSGAEFEVRAAGDNGQFDKTVARFVEKDDTGIYKLTNEKAADSADGNAGIYEEVFQDKAGNETPYLKEVGSEWKLLAGRYQIVETKAPAGYGKRPTPITVESSVETEGVFSVVSDGTSGSPDKVKIDDTLDVENEPQPIRLKKADSSGSLLKGAEFELQADGSVEKRTIYVTSDNGVVLENLITNQEYILTETKAPDGYIRTLAEVHFKVNKDRTVTLLNDNDVKGIVEIRKAQDEAQGTTILFKDAPIELTLEKMWTDDDGTWKPTDGVTEFALYEFTPGGADEAKGRQLFNGDSDVWRTDESGKLTISAPDVKASAGAGDSADGNVFRAEGTYLLEETKAAPGYVTPKDAAAELIFKVNEDGTFTILNRDGTEGGNSDGTDSLPARMLDSNKGFAIANQKTEVTIQKLGYETDEAAAKPISGGTFGIYRKGDVPDAKPLVQWENKDGEAFVVTGTLAERNGLDENVYELRELTRPAGYLKADPIPFVIENGQVYLKSGEDLYTIPADGNQILMKDRKVLGKIALQKLLHTTDGADEKITGVAFDLLQKNQDGEYETEPMRTQWVGGEGELTFGDLPEGSYRIVENREKSEESGAWKAPDNVYIDEAWYAEVKVTVDDSEKKIAVQLVNSNDTDSTQAEETSDFDTADDTLKFAVKNTAFAAGLKLVKGDAEDGTLLKGVKFQLEKQDADGNYQPYPSESGNGMYETDTDGVLSIENLTKGAYRLTEVETLYGYKPIQTETPTFQVQFTVSNKEQGETLLINRTNAEDEKYKNKWQLTVTAGKELLRTSQGRLGINNDSAGVVNERAAGSVTFLKVDAEETTIGLAGTEFQLSKERDGNWIQKAFQFLTGNTYELKQSFGGDEIEQSIADSGTDGVDTSEAGRLTIRGLEWGKYKIVETKAKSGYVKSTTEYEFEIGPSGMDVTLGVDDTGKITNMPNEITLEKCAANRLPGDSGEENLLDGAEFTITNENPDSGEAARTITVQNGKISLKRALTGGEKYRLHETKAPAGYRLNPNDIVFLMGEDGQIYTSEDGTNFEQKVPDNRLVVRDEPTSMEFRKVGKVNETCSDTGLGAADPETVIPLAGVEFTVYAADDGALTKPIQTVHTDADGRAVFNELPEGEYLVKETKTLPGYVLDTEIYRATVVDGAFEGLRDAQGNLVGGGADNPLYNTIVNDVYRTDIRLRKVNEQNPDEVIPGAEYGLYKAVETEAGKQLQLVAKAVTDKNGTIEFRGVLVDTEYTIQELNAPDGSYVSEQPIKISYEIDENGQTKIKAFDGGSVDGRDTAYLDENGQIVWREPSVQAAFVKTDETGKPLAGAKLQIVDAEENVIEEWESSETPHLTMQKLVRGKSYELREVSAPAGYSIAEPVKFTVDDEKVGPGEEKVISVEMIDLPTSVRFLKAAEGTGEILDGATFRLEGEFADGSSVQEITPGPDGAVLKGLLIIGKTYSLTETKAPAEYQLNTETVVFEIDERGEVYIQGVKAEANQVSIADKPTHIEFQKAGKVHELCSDTTLGAADAAYTVPLEGVEFTAYSAENPETPIKTAKSSSEGVVAFDGLPTGEYLLRETSTPDGYVSNTETVYRAVVTDGAFEGLRDAQGELLADNTVVNDVPRMDILLRKVNEQNPEEVIPGSEYGLFKAVEAEAGKRSRAAGAEAGKRSRTAEDAEEKLQLIAKAVTDENGMIEFRGVLIDTEYIIQELKAPDGSYMSEKPIRIKYVIDENGEVRITEFDDGSVDDKKTAYIDENGQLVWLEPSVQIELAKTDEAGNPLAGAKLQIVDESGTVVEEWESSETPYLSIRKLALGQSYELREASAPAGYSIAEPVKFTVDDEKVGPGENKVISVVMKDSATNIKIFKAAEETGDLLEGAKFVIEGSFADGSSTQEIMPGKDGSTLEKLFVVGNSYTLTEQQAPEGYEKLEAPITFTVNEKGAPEAAEGEQNVKIEAADGGYQITVFDKKSETPDKPDTPGGSTGGETPDKPDTPGGNTGGDKPDKPDTPGGSTGGETPDKPDTPGGSTGKDTPDKPGGQTSTGTSKKEQSSGEPGTPTTTSGRRVKTGDSSPFVLYGMVLLLSAGAVVGVRRRKRR